MVDQASRRGLDSKTISSSSLAAVIIHELGSRYPQTPLFIPKSVRLELEGCWAGFPAGHGRCKQSIFMYNGLCADAARSSERSPGSWLVRVSTNDQETATQAAALRAAGCERIYREKASGGRWDQPELHRLLDQLRKGNVLGSGSSTGSPVHSGTCSPLWGDL
jgi:hypothetical protein